MVDGYNRKIDYIRISVTDRCNLRCVYCMPEKGRELVKHSDILSYEEIIYLCKMFSKIGISKIKITGGEPLVRRNLNCLIENIKNISGIKNVTLTTNGILLEEQIEALVNAGIDGINISMDALDKNTYRKITRIGEVDKVIRGIDKTLAYGCVTVKINCVPINGKNNEQLLDIASMAKDRNINVRFIELMPIGIGRFMKGISENEIKFMIEEKFGELTTFNGKIGNGPSRYYTLNGFKGKIGFISAITHEFCEECNRIRLTSQGFLKTCLQYDKGIDLRKLLAHEYNESDIIKLISEAVYNKPKSHKFLEEGIDHVEDHRMFEIGG